MLDTALTRAAGPGLEPEYPGPKPGVLPLDDPAIFTNTIRPTTNFSI